MPSPSLGGCARPGDAASAQCPLAIVDGGSGEDPPRESCVRGASMARSSCHHRCARRPRLAGGLAVALRRAGAHWRAGRSRTLPRDPTASVLYTVVREHVETFRVEAARLRDGQGLPRFVDAEFAAFLRCGFLAASAPTPPVCHARWEGFDLHAGVRIPAGHRDRLEQVCRYALRPPVSR